MKLAVHYIAFEIFSPRTGHTPQPTHWDVRLECLEHSSGLPGAPKQSLLSRNRIRVLVTRNGATLMKPLQVPTKQCPRPTSASGLLSALFTATSQAIVITSRVSNKPKMNPDVSDYSRLNFNKLAARPAYQAVFKANSDPDLALSSYPPLRTKLLTAE